MMIAERTVIPLGPPCGKGVGAHISGADDARRLETALLSSRGEAITVRGVLGR